MADTGILVRLSLKLMWFKIAIGNPYGVISLGHSLFNLKSFEVFFQFALKVAKFCHVIFANQEIRKCSCHCS